MKNEIKMLKGLVIIQERKVATFIAYVATLMALYYSTVVSEVGMIWNICTNWLKFTLTDSNFVQVDL